MNLHRFWFKFGALEPYNSLGLGCGVTAHNYDDAINVLRETVFAGKEVPQIESFIEDVDIRELDQRSIGLGIANRRRATIPSGWAAFYWQPVVSLVPRSTTGYQAWMPSASFERPLETRSRILFDVLAIALSSVISP